MNSQLLIAAQRVPILVHRGEELEIIKKAIYQPRASCQVVFLYGSGGMGKSRLAEEVLWRGGNWEMRRQRGPIPAEHPDWDWTRHGNAVVADLIDLTSFPLHARAGLMRAIRDGLIWEGSGISFTNYDAAYANYQRLRHSGGEYSGIQQASQAAEKEFFRDYKENAKNRRLVLVLDTVEKLFLIGSEWLRDKGLIKHEDLLLYTTQWLADQIQNCNLPNTTLLLVGREEDGKPFFDLMRGAIEQAGQDCAWEDIAVKPFDLNNTRVYFEALSRHWQNEAKVKPEFARIAETTQRLAKDLARVETIWHYTGGQPVRLALYTDLIMEGRAIPEPLNDKPDAARARIEATGLEQARLEIEDEFIRLSFAHPKSRRAEILQALVRAPRGLDAEQLHFAINSNREDDPSKWVGKEEQETIKQIQNGIEALRNLALVKIRPDGRLGLQDEVYRIYAEHLSRIERDRQDEQDARLRMYTKLSSWAEYRRRGLEKERAEFQAWDERGLKLDSPIQSRSVSFPPVTEREAKRRVEILEEIQKWELEGIHYSLLLDLSRKINHDYFELGYRWWRAGDEEADAVAQTELWQVLRDKHAVTFIPMNPWPSLEKRDEKVIDALLRVAQQDDVTRWIKRFVLRKQYERAVQFCEAVEKEVQAFEDETTRNSWTHTFARGERECWKGYARILMSQDIPNTLREMEKTAKDLEALAARDQHTLVFPKRNEAGFIGHPGESRLHRVIAILYNFIGYGYATLGLTRKAIIGYGKSIRYMREVEFTSQQAITRNNLSRVLSDRGYARPRRVCLDGLNLRKQEGADVPIGYSYNTLALIDNDHLRPDLAWREAATAVAYFRRVEEPRGLGLALIQLGEALRRLPKLKGGEYFLAEPLDIIYDEAERIMTEAIDLFLNSPARGETVRLIEAWIEMGCLQRDRIVSSEGREQKQRRSRDALYYLGQAVQKAQELGIRRLELDAQVNIGWTHYYLDEIEKAEEAMKQAENILSSIDDCWIREKQALPSADRDDLYIYQQLSKIFGLRGKMAMENFQRRATQIESEQPTLPPAERHKLIHEDKKAQDYLHKAAEGYVLGLGYAQLLSPRSSALSILYDALYDYLKKFNPTEMKDFHKYEHEARERYKTSEIKLVDLGNLDEFLRDCFGIFAEGS
ncbi:MAG: ATP-binding protein [Anaerolineales bacterium]|nr:ATP-binding protein [Anaerolineales bacterium]